MLATENDSAAHDVIAGCAAQQRDRIFRTIAFGAALAVLLIAAWAVYSPGLSGDFLFDDFGNLPALGATGPIDHWATFWRYITSGTADPTGRPLTLLSFLIDARNWPANPQPFKLTNVLLHLLNGALLCAVLLRLGRVLGLKALHARAAALFGAGAWLLHPLLVSTTLYVVQREAMLPATFTLIGMLAWVQAHEALASGHLRRGLTGMVIAAWGCTLLAVLSKANGILLPLLLMLLEWIALSPRQPMPSDAMERKRRTAVWILLVAPAVLLLAYMLLQIPSAVRDAAAIRDWSIGQRLLSESRALMDYLALLWVPRAHSLGLFTDGFVASTTWLQPRSTLPCMMAVLLLIGAALAIRKRHPAMALALLFYFAGQLLESTWLPLELYYEHRNYLPAMLMFWPLGIGLCSEGFLRWAGRAIAAGILVALGTLTYARASLWGDGYHQAQIWAAFNQNSARAQTSAAQYDMAHGQPRLAQARLLNALPTHPDDAEIPANLIGAECKLNTLRPQTLAAANYALSHNKTGGGLVFNWFENAIQIASSGSCHGLDFEALQDMLGSMRRNPNWQSQPGRKKDIAHMQGSLDLAEQKPRSALDAFNRALAVEPNPDTVLEQAAILGARGYPDLGIAHLDYYATLTPAPVAGFGMPRIHQWVLDRQHYWRHEAARLRATLTADAATRESKRMSPRSNGSN